MPPPSSPPQQGGGTKPPPPPPPRGSGGTNVLTQKLGPAPVFVWLLVAGGLYVGYRVFFAKTAGATVDPNFPPNGGTGGGTGSGGGGGDSGTVAGSGGGASPAGALPASLLDVPGELHDRFVRLTAEAATRAIAAEDAAVIASYTPATSFPTGPDGGRAPANPVPPGTPRPGVPSVTSANPSSVAALEGDSSFAVDAAPVDMPYTVKSGAASGAVFPSSGLNVRQQGDYAATGGAAGADTGAPLSSIPSVEAPRTGRAPMAPPAPTARPRF